MVEAMDAVALTRRLISYDTVNPPGNEAHCARFLGDLLESAGFAVAYHEFSPGRPTLIARAGDCRPERTLCFLGHLDTVPLGHAAWSADPFAGDIRDDKLYGRGASDMKAGVAAFVVAAMRSLDGLEPGAGLMLILAAGEETGCEGSRHLVTLGVDLGTVAGVVVGEPTSNYPLVGHKGALWLKASTKGVTAHGSMPHLGVNAVVQGAEMVTKLADFGFNQKPHEVLGSPTINVGNMRGGANINSVPDWAEVGIDIRTVPGMDHGAIRDQITHYLQPHLHDLCTAASMPHIWTDPAHPWIQGVYALAEPLLGFRPEPRGAAYFSDASALVEVLGSPPTVILGPGEPSMAHQTDEYCLVSRIEQAVDLYSLIIRQTCAADEAAATA
ncbi:M20 family metallopeptidase [Azospirillum rugosum]|uniref:Probable succinyl-diaminopimelate desuccinylase n=1 Tax=Azospirillum rugosum TaxID=416170 RepID=A0ABS4SMX1_9PROT|nr:M20 family metallopeptidase [Azospirillum rugosum]MBP2293272.1 succinyl-diaminopimelate desuccinylase [Azospirillum rugosum]